MAAAAVRGGRGSQQLGEHHHRHVQFSAAAAVRGGRGSQHLNADATGEDVDPVQRPPSAAAEDRNWSCAVDVSVSRWQRPPSAAAEDRNLTARGAPSARPGEQRPPSAAAEDRNSWVGEHDEANYLAAAAVRGGRGSQRG